MSEDEAPILEKNTTEISFDKKMANNGCEGFLPTTKFYKNANYTALLDPGKRKTEGKVDVQLDGTSAKNQEQRTTNQLATCKIHANELHTKIGHPGEERMSATAKSLHYNVKGTLEICE